MWFDKKYAWSDLTKVWPIKNKVMWWGLVVSNILFQLYVYTDGLSLPEQSFDGDENIILYYYLPTLIIELQGKGQFECQNEFELSISLNHHPNKWQNDPSSCTFHIKKDFTKVS